MPGSDTLIILGTLLSDKTCPGPCDHPVPPQPLELLPGPHTPVLAKPESRVTTNSHWVPTLTWSLPNSWGTWLSSPESRSSEAGLGRPLLSCKRSCRTQLSTQWLISGATDLAGQQEAGPGWWWIRHREPWAGQTPLLPPWGSLAQLMALNSLGLDPALEQGQVARL